MNGAYTFWHVEVQIVSFHVRAMPGEVTLRMQCTLEGTARECTTRSGQQHMRTVPCWTTPCNAGLRRGAWHNTASAFAAQVAAGGRVEREAAAYRPTHVRLRAADDARDGIQH